MPHPVAEGFGHGLRGGDGRSYDFSDAGPPVTTAVAERGKEAMLQRGFVKHPEKDVDDALTTTRVGIDLAGGSDWCPPALRLWGMLNGLYELSTVRVGAPGGVASYVGAAQCFSLGV